MNQQKKPTIIRSEVERRAIGFAEDLAEKLDELNREHEATGLPIIDPTDMENPPHPDWAKWCEEHTPEKMRGKFQEVFRNYMAEHYTILEDEDDEDDRPPDTP